MSAQLPNGLVTTKGQELKARLLKGEVIAGLGWAAWGAGNWADKENPPIESVLSTALASEVVRKQLTRISFLVQDAAGPITYKGKTWKETTTPGPVIAAFATLAEGEATAAQITEEAIFGGLVQTTAAPLATPGQVVAPGLLYWIRHRPIVIKGVNDSISLVAIFDETE